MVSTETIQVWPVYIHAAADCVYITPLMLYYQSDAIVITSVFLMLSLTAGVNTAEMGVQPVMTYSVFGGGRFFPMVSREVGLSVTYIIPSSVNYKTIHQ